MDKRSILSRPKVGIIGLGFGIDVHLPAWREHAEVVGCAGRTSAQSSQMASLHGLVPFSVDEILEHKDISIISFAVPPEAQPELVRKAVKMGKHVFCEKPLSHSYTLAQECVKAVTESKLHHAVDFIFPDLPAWKAMKEELSSLGAIKYGVLTWFVKTRVYRSQTPHWKKDPHVGGGVLFNFASHVLYALEFLFGPISCVSTGQSLTHAHVNLLLDFHCGVSVSVTIGTDAEGGSGYRFEVYAENGSLHLDNSIGDLVRGFSLKKYSRTDERWCTCVEPQSESLEDGRISVVAEIIGRFLESIRSGTVMIPNLNHALRVQELINFAYQSHICGRRIEVPCV